jgi:hypothetical protein
VFIPAVGDRDSDDLRQNSSALFPPEFYVRFLNDPTIRAKIGAEVSYSECPNAPFVLFERTGDVRNHDESLPTEVLITWLGRANSPSSASCTGRSKDEDTHLGKQLPLAPPVSTRSLFFPL